ncbi:MAG: hypothetical protein ACKVQJ_15525 [Pyrinomonadaceae bacterium]
MKKIIVSLFAIMMLAVFATAAFAQKPTRITFKAGATSATVTGTLTGYKSHRTFVIRVLEGQTLTTESTGKNHITIGIDAPPGSTYEQDMAADCHDHNEVTPTAKGDYKITVTECTKADPWKGSFKFKVVVN